MNFLRRLACPAGHIGHDTPRNLLIEIGKALLVLSAAYYIITFVILAFMRNAAFVELDWIEGMHLLQVHRILKGMPLYTPPSSEYIPLIYGPLYPYVSAFAAFFAGEGYAALRLVSVMSTLGTLILTGMLVHQMTRSKQAAWVAAGLYAGAYGVVGFWFDVARVDSLFIFLTVMMAYFLRIACRRGGSATMLAVGAAVCAVLTKQTALVPVLGLCAWCLTWRSRRANVAAMLCLSAVFLSQLLLAMATDGWFYFYVYQVPAAHPVLKELILRFIASDFLRHLSAGFLVSILAGFIMWRAHPDKKDALFFFLLLVSMVFAGLAPRFKTGGHVNNLMPLAVVLALGGGLLLGHLRDFKIRDALAIIALLLVFNLQIFYWPAKAIPSAEVLERTRIQLRLYQGLEVPVFAPGHAYLPVLAGKNESAFWASMVDLWLMPGKEAQDSRDDLARSLREKRFKAVVLRSDFFYLQNHFPHALLREYYQKMDLTGILTKQEAEQSRLIPYVPRREASLQSGR